MADSESFDAFAAGRWRQLLRAGWLLTGDWASAEDLAQATLERTWANWSRVSAADEPEAYVRRILTNEYLSRQRRRGERELPVERLPEQPSPDAGRLADQRVTLLAAMNTLPRLQRAAVVLRYFEDLTVEQTAAALACSVGNVKSQTSRALQKLRTSPFLIDSNAESQL